MTQPDHNPPPRNDMSAPSTEAMEAARKISFDVYDGNADKCSASFAIIIQSAIDQSTAAMREALVAVQTRMNVHGPAEVFGQVAKALSTHAGADLLRELTAMRGAMTERNTLSERTTDALLKRVQALEAALSKARDMAGIYMDCAGHHSDGDDPCPKCELAKAITAALSQEQATTRNV